jgi:predicted  nucleic acid-binding Zn-ribbon protein
MNTIKLPRLLCLRCGHQWLPRTEVIYTCPKCQSRRWNEPPEQDDKPDEQKQQAVR